MKPSTIANNNCKVTLVKVMFRTLIQRSHHLSSHQLLRHAPSRSILSRSLSTPTRPVSARKWKKDDIFALTGWFLVGTGTFILIGTTTAASLGLLLANSLQFQEFVAGKLSGWLTRSSGWKVSFASAIVPNWQDGRITLKDVSIELGPSLELDPSTTINIQPPAYDEAVPSNENYTRFSVQLDRLDVRISLRRWLEGRGWLEDLVIDGARGTLDKRWVRYIEGWRWQGRPGDFDLESVVLRNVHLSVIQPAGFHPYNVTILSAYIPRLRAEWLFFDLLSVDSAHGIFDGRSLFTIHSVKDRSDSDTPLRNIKHFRMLGLDVKHLSQSNNALSWVTRGTVDIEGLYQIPATTKSSESNIRRRIGSDPLSSDLLLTPDNFKERLLLPLLKENLSDSLLNPLHFLYEEKIRPKIDQILSDELVGLADRFVSQLTSFTDFESSPARAADHFISVPEDCVAFEVDFIFRNLKAKLPANATVDTKMTLLRPVIGYVNEHRPFIPLSCRFDLEKAAFLGAWSGHECGLFDSLSTALLTSFQNLVWDPEKRIQRIGKIGRWTLGNFIKKVNSINNNFT